MIEKRLILGETHDEERSFYALRDTRLINCSFEGPADGESALKEASGVEAEDCRFLLRYPLWHDRDFVLRRCLMTDTARAAIWYARDGLLEDCRLEGIKALRECDGIRVKGCEIVSPEFGWKCRNISLEDTRVTSEYLFLDSRDISLKNVTMKGKYSFQYIENLEITDSTLDTKDAFWHTKNVTVRNSLVKGEYLGWYSENLTLIHCRIIGTQPLCYCKNLRLVDCTMQGTDLAFEYSQVEAEVTGTIESVKNPKSGRILCDGVGQVIMDGSVMDCTGKVILRDRPEEEKYLSQGEL